MNCPNCGGVMEVSPGHGYFTCRYCGTIDFADGASDQGVRVLGPTEPAIVCPACGATLAVAVLDGHDGQYCPRCRGLRLPRGSFAAIVRRQRAFAEGPPVTPQPPDRREMRRQLACPVCHVPMIVDHYYGPGNVVLDRCDRCDSVWLDYGELQQIVDAPGGDRGSRNLS